MTEPYEGTDNAMLALIEQHLVELAQDLVKENATKEKIEKRIKRYSGFRNELRSKG